ncbi:hypothetical protein SLS58_004054 [Diplodia intermedia]|uniref:3-hydroxyisobutyrate dehydrogenase n=1 Tax=Diplodia intermedia TaxID=856260 RepID=A0ABR3TUN2_9PEZI
MARNLRKGLGSDQTLLICDIDKDTIARFQDEAKDDGPVGVVSNGFEAAKAAVPQPTETKLTPTPQNAVITMLPDAAAVESVYLDPTTGILAGISSTNSPNKLIMECGTIETATIAAISTAFSTTTPTSTFLDAPVSGGPMGASAGTLAFMVGAPSSTSFTHAVHSYLTHMGSAPSIFHCGGVGAGTAFKLINNYLSAITSLAASEALNIGVKAGLDPKLLTAAINAGGGQCWVTSKANPVPGVQEGVPSARRYEGGFRLELCAKVLRMGARLAESVGARTVLDRPTMAAFEEAGKDERYAGRDARVVYKWLSESERRE